MAQLEQIGDLTGKVALITGASSGLGRAMSRAFANAGAFIVNADRTPDPPKIQGSRETGNTPTVDLVNQQFPGSDGKPRMSFVQCDVTKAASMEAAVAFTVKTYGRLDIMVNNAGVTGHNPENRNARTHEQSEEMFDIGFDVNVKGVWLGIKYATAQMLKQDPHSSGDRGWIINMSSILGVVALPGSAIYCGTKGAVLQLTRACALEYAEDRIHINSIHPGFTDTSMVASLNTPENEGLHKMIDSLHPWARIGQPEEIAKMAVFLAGPGASFITGQPFFVDGGYVAR